MSVAAAVSLYAVVVAVKVTVSITSSVVNGDTSGISLHTPLDTLLLGHVTLH